MRVLLPAFVLAATACFTPTNPASPVKAAPGPATVAVLDFVDRSGRAPEGFGGVVADALFTELASSGKVTMVARGRIAEAVASLKLDPAAQLDDAVAATVGGRLGSRYVIVGTASEYRKAFITQSDGPTRDFVDFRIEVTVVDVRTGARIGSLGAPGGAIVSDADAYLVGPESTLPGRAAATAAAGLRERLVDLLK